MTTTTAIATANVCRYCKRTPTAPNFMRGLGCWNCLCLMLDDRYPVIVEYTHRHVVWVPASDQETAVRYLQNEPYEVTKDGETLVETGWKVNAPTDSWDWDTVYEGSYLSPYTGQEANAHVEAHREHLYRQARLELEAWVENEDRDQAAGRLAEADRRTCRVCPAWLAPGHTETVYHVNSAAMEARRAQFAAERAAAAAERQPAPS